MLEGTLEGNRMKKQRSIDILTQAKLLLICTELNKKMLKPGGGTVNLLSQVNYGINGAPLMEVAKKLELKIN
ncbi:hypothetical protein LCGC14_2525650 [marine sediment metagenome]|uniref:Uncharacterized protein n=1 Tax=marine sediment metagenome TaxID=412755 RepID=A0A0F9BHZ0_9ZZZZ